MQNLADPTIDVVFKAILGSVHHMNLLIHFINAILGLEDDQRVQKVTLRSTEHPRDFPSGKTTAVDVKATDQLGRDFHIEIQVGGHKALLERMLLSWASVFHGKIKRGQDFDRLKPVISIWLLVDNLPPMPVWLPGFPLVGQGKGGKGDLGGKRQSERVHLSFAPYCKEADVYLSDHFAIHVIQLKKQARNVRIEGDKDRWICFFRDGKNLDPDHLPKDMDIPEIREAMDIANAYRKKEDNYYNYLSLMDRLSLEATLRKEREELLGQVDAYKGEVVEYKGKVDEYKGKADEYKGKADEYKGKADEYKGKADEYKGKADEYLEQVAEERAAKEHLKALLKKAGIPYDLKD